MKRNLFLVLLLLLFTTQAFADELDTDATAAMPSNSTPAQADLPKPIDLRALREEGIKNMPAVKNYIAALKFNAEKGDAKSQAALARLYYDGGWIEHNLNEALKWAQRAAESGEIVGQLICIPGNQQKDRATEEEIGKWCHIAAEFGDGGAQNNMAYLYFNGRGGFAKDNVEAYFWAKLVTKKPEHYAYHVAQNTVEEIAQLLTEEQLARVNQRAEEWQPKQKPSPPENLVKVPEPPNTDFVPEVLSAGCENAPTDEKYFSSPHTSRINMKGVLCGISKHSRCEAEKMCGDIVGVDCGPAGDGSYYFVNRKTAEVLRGCSFWRGKCVEWKCTWP